MLWKGYKSLLPICVQKLLKKSHFNYKTKDNQIPASSKLEHISIVWMSPVRTSVWKPGIRSTDFLHAICPLQSLADPSVVIISTKCFHGTIA